MKLLVVEDENKTADYVRQGLMEAGFVVDLARNGLDGHHLAMGETYDLVVLDVMLPDVDGWRIVRALPDAGKQVPVLFLTARGGVTTVSRDWNWERTTTSSSHSRSLSCWRGCGRCCDAEALRASLIASGCRFGAGLGAPARNARWPTHQSHQQGSSRCLSSWPVARGGPSTVSDRVAGMGHEFRQRQQRHRCSHPPSTREDRRCVQSKLIHTVRGMGYTLDAPDDAPAP